MKKPAPSILARHRDLLNVSPFPTAAPPEGFLQPVVVVASPSPLTEAATLTSLQPDRRRSRRAVRLWVPALLLTALVGSWTWHWLRPHPPNNLESLPFCAKAVKAPLHPCHTEVGEVASTDVVEIRNPVQTVPVNLAYLLPYGTRVQAGQVVARFDLAPLRAAIAAEEQLLHTAQSKLADLTEALEMSQSKHDGDLASAQLQVELAISDHDRYVKDEKQVELNDRRAAVATAERDVKDAEEKLSYYRTFHKRGFITTEQLRAKEAEASRARFNLTQSQARLQIFEKYTMPRQERQLKAKVEEVRRELARVKKSGTTSLCRAKMELASHKQTLAAAEQRLAGLRQQLMLTELKAPRAGILFAAAGSDPAKAKLAVGSVVAPSQALFCLPDLAKLQVRCRLDETTASLLRPGQTVRVKNDENDDGSAGSIAKIEFQAEEQPASDLDEGGRDFVATITLAATANHLRPGHKARVEFPREPLDEVVQVPVPAVTEKEGRHFAQVKGLAGIETREVVPGASDGKNLEIKEGITEGEEVVLHLAHRGDRTSAKK